MKTDDFLKSSNYCYLISARDALEHCEPKEFAGIDFDLWFSAKSLLDKMISELSDKLDVE